MSRSSPLPAVVPAAACLVLSTLLLVGCASEQALIEQARPLQDRLTGVEQQVSALAGRMADADKRLAGLAEDGRAQAGQREADLNRAASDAAEARAAVAGQASRLDQMQARLDQLAAEQTRSAGQQGALTTAAEQAGRAQETRLAHLEKRLDDLDGQVREAMALAAKEIFLAYGKESMTVTLTDDRVLYPLNDPTLDSRDMAKLDDLAARLAKLEQEYHLDIQGHTDDTSTEDNNYNLGKARAEVVKRYLAERRGVSINRMSTISYGSSKPLGANAPHNRRIHIRVLVLK